MKGKKSSLYKRGLIKSKRGGDVFQRVFFESYSFSGVVSHRFDISPGNK
jgi:hypothetical protein